MSCADWILRHAELLSAEQRGKNQLRHVFRQRSDCGNNQRRRAAKKHGDRQRLIQSFGFVIVKAAALLNLPVQPGCRFVKNLHSINAEVMLLRYRMFGVDQRQRNEWPAIFLPGCQHRQMIESRLALDDISDRSPRHSLRSQFQEIAHQRTMFPKLRSVRREQRLGHMDNSFDELLGLRSKGEIDPFRGSKEIGDYREWAALHPLEQERRTAFFNHPAMYLG